MYDLNGVGSIKNHQKLKPKYLPETSYLSCILVNACFFSKLPECGWAVNQSLYQQLLKRHHQNRMNKPNLKSNKLAALKLYVYICMNRRTEFTFILTTVTKVPKYMPVQDFRATSLYFIDGSLPSRHERRFCLHLVGFISE